MKSMFAAAGAAVVLAALAFAPRPAHALPTVTGSNCNSNWVNNEEALSCFIQGEDETNGGAAHPHYVACSPDGGLYCCVDSDKGAQTCNGIAAAVRPATISQQLHAILAGQAAIRSSMNRMSSRMDALEKQSAEKRGQ